MPRFEFRRLAVSLLAALVSLGAAPLVQAQPVKVVGVVAIVDHPALNSIRKGVEDELKALGWENGKNLRLLYQSAQGSTATAGQIARKFSGDKVDVIVAIATPSAQAAAAATKTIPVVFSAVTDPIAAKLVKDWKPSGTNVTGVSDHLPLAAQVDLLLKVKPGAKRVGYVYSPGEANATSMLKELKAELAKRGMSVVEAAAPRTVDIPSAAKSLVGKADVIYTTTDNNVVSAYESMVRVAMEAKLPLVAADVDSVKRGAVAALGMHNHEMGRQAGKIVDRILRGTPPGTIAPEISKGVSLALNPRAAEKQGVKLSEALLKEAAEIVK
ncbi:ABC transporter substrate-binding protein [Ottowia thiooxydans]|uniref:ABC transporter substrate-binding protein n=1 Tax=Ottowia thiooxydans TaxID=219182 RepID=UPI000A074B49|nr:ABC transporter substrate-binding protein [Ottowia thiooxydans]